MRSGTVRASARQHLLLLKKDFSSPLLAFLSGREEERKRRERERERERERGEREREKKSVWPGSHTYRAVSIPKANRVQEARAR